MLTNVLHSRLIMMPSSAVLVLAFFTTGNAQSTATLQGRVSDPDGSILAGLAGVEITLLDHATGVTRIVKADSESKGTHLILRRNLNQSGPPGPMVNGVHSHPELSGSSLIMPGSRLDNITQAESSSDSSYNSSYNSSSSYNALWGIGIISLCIIQAGLIAVLLIERRRRRRVREALDDRLRFETLLSDLSADFTDLRHDEADSKIKMWLDRIVQFLGVDRGHFFKALMVGEKVYYTHSYSVPGTEPTPEINVQQEMPWYVEQLRRGT